MTASSHNSSSSTEDQANAANRPALGRSWVKWLLLVTAALVVAYAIVVRPLTRSAGAARAGAVTRAMPVTAEPARKTNLNIRIVALGTVTPVSTATVRSRVDGQLQKILFQEGHYIEAGAPLAEIDPRPFEVQKQQAEAQFAKDTALLENAHLDLDRFNILLSQDSISKQQVDTQQALVRQYEASVKLDQAQIDTASLQLSYAHITAPISGRAGLRQVDLGNIIHASDASGIVVIAQLRPITVVFAIPQDALPKVMNRLKTDDSMVVEAFDRDGRTLLAKGRLVTVDNQIDSTTGTVKLRAEFPNTDETLFPNQFVNVQLLVEQLQDVTAVPSAAVQRGTAGTYVYIVADQATASVRPVETGPSEKGMIVISKGLVPGDVVVVDGVDKLRDGSQVELIGPAKETPTGTPSPIAPRGDKSRKRSTDGAKPAQN